MAQIEMVQVKEVDLIKLCEKAGITLKQLSDETGISYTYLSRMNSGVVKVKMPRWIQIKNVLDKYNN
jgi:predicted transcriptional regulator